MSQFAFVYACLIVGCEMKELADASDEKICIDLIIILRTKSKYDKQSTKHTSKVSKDKSSVKGRVQFQQE